MDDAHGLSDIRFAPNPAEGSVQLTGLGADSRWTLTVRTLLGQEVLAERGVGRETVDLSGLSTGTYVGEVQTDKGTAMSLRLVVPVMTPFGPTVLTTPLMVAPALTRCWWVAI